MSLPWPSEHVSRTGLVECLAAAVSLIVGIAALQRFGLTYLEPLASNWSPLVVGVAGLSLCSLLLFRLVRRREYPWIMAVAAVALPLFHPADAPYGATDRIVFAVRDFALLVVAVAFIVRAMRRADELEQRIHLTALAWSFTATLVVLVAYSVAEDVLPPLRGVWVASLMLGAWVAAWLVASLRYQR